MSDDRSLLPLYALAAHAAGDWPLQSDRMAAEKLDDAGVRAEHVAVYTLSFLPVMLAADWNRRASDAFAVTLAGSHYLIDMRRWKQPVDGFPSRPIWFDQVFHVIALALAMALGEEVNDV